jgi:pectate lyase-like protein
MTTAQQLIITTTGSATTAPAAAAMINTNFAALMGTSGVGAYNIFYLPPGTGAVPRTLASSVSQLVTSVVDYGADGSGATDSYPAFLAAYTYMLTTGGGNLFVPAGTYRLNSTLVMTGAFINLVGEGPGSLILNGQTNAPAIQLGNGTQRYYKIDVSNLGFGQVSGVVPVAGNCGLYVNEIGQSRFYNIYVSNYPTGLYQGIIFNNVSQVQYHDNQVEGCLNTGVYWKGGSLDIYMNGSRSDANGSNGWQIEDSQAYTRLTARGTTTLGTRGT